VTLVDENVEDIDFDRLGRADMVWSTQSKSSLNTLRRRMTTTLPRSRSSVRCMSTWRVVRTSRSRMP
jgi:hypothetical protein